MKIGWNKVTFREVFDLELDAVSVDISKSYEMTGVLSYGRGLFAKANVCGVDTSYKTFYRLNEGQFVLSQLFGWEGAIAPVSNEFVGRFVSSQFPTFRPKKCLNPRFAHWMLRYPDVWEQLKNAAKGMGDRRRTLSPEIFYNVELAVPSDVEQERIASRLDAIETRIIDVKMVREKIKNEMIALVHSSLHEDRCDGIRTVPMSDLVTWRTPDTQVVGIENYTFAGVYSFGRGVFRKEAKSGLDFSYDRLTKLKAGEFTYPKLMAWEGALGVVPADCDACYVSPEFPVFSIDETKVLPEIIDIHFKTPSVWQKLADISTGTNVRRRRLNPKAFLNYEFPLPPMKTQERIAKLSARLKRMIELSEKSTVHHDALLPSLLDQIFTRDSN